MQALKPNDVLARVVAWHNSHPLARRIQPTQVHSIGAVVMPFASAQPLSLAGLAPQDQAEPQTSTLPHEHGLRRRSPAPPVESPASLAATDAEPTLLQEHPAAAEPEPEPEAAPDTPQTESRDPQEANEPVAPAGTPAEEADAASAEASAEASEQAEDLPGEDAEPPTLEAEFVMASAAPEAPKGEASDAAAAAQTLAGAAPDTEGPTSDLGTPEPEVQDLEAEEAAQASEPEVAQGAPEDDPATAPPLATRLQAAKAAALAGEPDPAAEPIPATAALAAPTAAAATHGPASPRAWWRRLWPWGSPATGSAASPAKAASKPKPAKLVPLFNPKFLWPLSPQQVAQWARQHAALSPMAQADWPRRALQAEPGLLQQARSKGQCHTGQLHVLTAAIGVGDRRIRVLIGADGQVLGPRAFDKRRIAVVAGVTLFMATLVVSRWPHQHEAADALALPAEAAASAPAPRALDLAHAPASAASADQPASASAAAEGHGTPADRANAHAAADPQAAAGAMSEAAAPGFQAPADAPTATDQADDAGTAPALAAVTSTPPPRFPQRRASGPLANIRPQLSAEERLVARQQSEAARGTDQGKATAQPEPATTSPVTANLRFAVVTLGTTQREPAEAYLAQLLSVRAQMPSPGTARTELVQQQGQWRAALWPFATVGDAERARTMLATRGLKTEVVAF